MKLAIYGPYGSGKTSCLTNYLKKYKNPLILHKDTRIKGKFHTLSFKDVVITLSSNHIMKEIEEDYIFYLMYLKYFKDMGYKDFQEFLKDVRFLMDILFLKGISIKSIHSTNKLFSLFKKVYMSFRTQLKSNRILFYWDALNDVKPAFKDYFRNYDIIGVDDIENFALDEIKIIMNSSRNLVVTYSDNSLTCFFQKNKFEIENLKGKNINNIKEKYVSNPLLFFYLKSLYNKDTAFLLTKKTRRKIENFIRIKKIEVQENKELDALYNYLGSIKYNLKNNKEKPEILERLEKINKALHAHLNNILEFFESYENVFFYKLPNVFSDAPELLGKRYEILYIEDKVLTNTTISLYNKLLPSDFFVMENILTINNFRGDLEFYKSKANTVFIVKGGNEEDYSDLSIDYIDNKSKNNNIFSFSQINTYLDCPYKYMLKYVYDIPEEPTPFFIFGGLIHKLIEDFSNKEIIKKEIFNIFKQKMYEHRDLFKSHFEYYLKKGKKMLNNFLRYDEILKQNYKTKGVEIKIKVKITENMEIVGIIDKLLYDEKKGAYFILDYKTSKPYKGKFDDTKGKEQLTLYSYLLNESEGIKVKKAILWFLEDNTLMGIDIDDIEILQVINKIKRVVERINKKIFTPKPSSKCQYCSYKLLCRYWQGTR